MDIFDASETQKVKDLINNPQNITYSENVHQSVDDLIQDFKSHLKSKESLQLVLPNVGKGMIVERITAPKPNLLAFEGILDGLPTVLLQHPDQLCLALQCVHQESEPASVAHDDCNTH